MAMCLGEMIGGRQEPGEEIERAGEDRHFIVRHKVLSIFCATALRADFGGE